MPAPEGIGSAPSPSLFVSLRSFWSVILATFYTRLDLVTAELTDEAIRAVKVLAIGVSALLAFATAFFFMNVWIIVAFWDVNRLLAIGIVLGVYLIIGLVGVFAIVKMVQNWPKFLSQTIAELRRDVEGLSTAITTHRGEP